MTDKLDEKHPRSGIKRIDYEQVELFGKCSLSIEDMAVLLNITQERIQTLMANETSKFFKRYRKGQAKTRLNILQQQISTALGIGPTKGHSQLLMHLGSILLGQNPSKKSEDNLQNTAEKLVENVSDAQKAEMFTVLMGEEFKQNKPLNDQDE